MISKFLEKINGSVGTITSIISIVAAIIMAYNYFAKQEELDTTNNNLKITQELFYKKLNDLDNTQRYNTIKALQFYLAIEILHLRRLKVEEPILFSIDKKIKLRDLEMTAQSMNMKEPYTNYVSIVNFVPLKSEIKLDLPTVNTEAIISQEGL